jgi:hypothetical protein
MLAPPGTPKERAEIIKGAFHKAFDDAEFLKRFHPRTGAEAAPLMPDKQARAVRKSRAIPKP